MIYNNRYTKWVYVSATLCCLVACGNTSSKDVDNEEAIGEADSVIVHNGIAYGTVISPYTGKIWLDKNIGAARVCENLNDTACYGDYYQWGRNTDGHEDSGSSITSIKAKNINNIGHSDFITNSVSSYDWAIVDNNGENRQNNWSSISGNSVCPIGFRVPTISEFKNELFNAGSASIENGSNAFSTFLKLPSAGHRFRSSALLLDQGSWGSIWSSSASGKRAAGIYFTPQKAGWYNDGGRANGRSVRCIKN